MYTKPIRLFSMDLSTEMDNLNVVEVMGTLLKSLNVIYFKLNIYMSRVVFVNNYFAGVIW